MRTFGELYANIFRQALIDDVSEIKQIIYKDLINLGFSKTYATDYIDSIKDEIKGKVALYIQKEADNWPQNNRSAAYKNRIKIAKEYISYKTEDSHEPCKH